VARVEADDETGILAVALGLGALEVAGWSEDERALVAGVAAAGPERIAAFRAAIEAGADPLGEAFCKARSPARRRPMGATFTPPAIVAAMLAWATRQESAPTVVVDPGVGSGRFLAAAGRCFPLARLHGVDLDPVATVLARGHLAALGFAARSEVRRVDYRAAMIPHGAGPTLFVGNPPYVRHHLIDAEWKAWWTRTARAHSLSASQLAGLHLHFYLATALHARPGDLGCFVTAAEWLDVNYGSLLRELFLGALGGESLSVIEPEALPFDDAQTTAAIATFRVGSRPASVRVQRVGSPDGLGMLEGETSIPREALQAATRWTPLTRAHRRGPAGYVELGELCRVHRGQVTGHNQVWIAGDHSRDLPSSVLFPCITRAAELFAAGAALRDGSHLKRVIDIPPDLADLSTADRAAVLAFLSRVERLGVATGYIARHRKAWWSVGLRRPAPILATYMARRPPAFVRNLAEARHINIAHGLYPRDPMPTVVMDGLARWLSQGVSLTEGRAYAGGLTKFEPREMERLRVPPRDVLAHFATSGCDS
jgi:hypothetical protein